MENSEEKAAPDFATYEEPQAPDQAPQQPPLKKQSWIEVLVDPRTLQGLMLCGGGLLVLGLVTWLWAIGVFENKLIVASCLGVANGGLLALGLAGAKYSPYQTASKAITALACLVMPLNLWFYDAQGLITLDQGGHLWVPALACCALYVLVARLLADPLFVNAIVGGVTMTGLLILADQQVDRLWEIIAPSSFLVIVGILCIHVERAFPPENGPFSRKNFGRAFFNAGHVVMGLGLAVLFVGRVVGRLYEQLFTNVDWLTLPEVATQANLKLMAIVLVLSSTYAYVYSQIVVRGKGSYVGSALLTFVWAAIMVFDLLQIALTVELIMLVVALPALMANLLDRSSDVQLSEEETGSPIKSLVAPVWQAGRNWANGLNLGTLALGIAIWSGVRFDLAAFVGSGRFSVLYVIASLIGAAACWLATRTSEESTTAQPSRWQLQGAAALVWLAVDATFALLNVELTIWLLSLEVLAALGLAIASQFARQSESGKKLALLSEPLATLPLVVVFFAMFGLVDGVSLASSHLGLTVFFSLSAASLGLSSRVSERLLPAILTAASICAATWQGFLMLGIDRYVFILAMTFIGITCLVLSRITQRDDGSSSQFATVSQWTGRLCISTASVATLLISLARLLSSESDWPLLGLVAAQVAANGVAGLLSKQSGWRRHFWVLATGQLLMSVLVYNTLIALSFWQRGEILATCVGLTALAVGYMGWYRETDERDELVSLNLAIGSMLSAIPLTIGMLVQRFDNQLADWGWVLIHEAGVLSIGLLLLGAGVLCRIRWSTIVGGTTLLVYVVSLVGMIHVPDKLQSTAIYMMVGGGLFFGTAVMLSVYRDRLLAIPQRIQNGEGLFRVLKWR